MTARTGIGFDVHTMVKGRPLVLGGVTIPSERGPMGHSDGDVLTHAIIDAMLGAAGLGDIGTFFPSSDASYSGVASTELLQTTVSLLRDDGWQTKYVDATIVIERPKLNSFLGHIKQTISDSLALDARLVNVKATTTDGMGFTGRGEGISALSVATVEAIH